MQKKRSSSAEGRCSGIADISYQIIDMIRRLLDFGYDIRHFGISTE